MRWCAAVLLLGGCASASVENDEALIARARAIHERVLTIDTHDDIPFNYATEGMNACDSTRLQVDIPKTRAGGLDVVFLIVYVGQGPRTPEGYARAREDALTKFNAIHRMTGEMCPADIQLAHSADQVAAIARTGKRVAVIGIENGYVIGRDLGLIRDYHQRGARYMTLAHGAHNDISDSATPAEGEHGGLSTFGEQVVTELNRVGMMVDVSHISKAAMLHALRVSRLPVIASHSSTRALADHPRNLDDEQLRALKRNGGVMQTVAFSAYVKIQPPERLQAIQALRERMGIAGAQSLRDLSAQRRAEYEQALAEIDRKWPRATVRDFVDHIDHAVRLIGIDHVGISSDFDGGGGVAGWNSAAETLNVTVELVRRGYSEAEIAKLWGGNLLRVWRAVERGAQTSQ
ncbi:MAG TPA: dipeptidase [Longimicrobiales bacterium]|nr:dipeptidase [Longimicrobiales bacterium]